MRITAKGQVTIPIEIRNQLGLLPDTEVIFEVEGGAVRILRAVAERQTRGSELIRLMRGKGTVAMTTDEIMALTRGEA